MRHVKTLQTLPTMSPLKDDWNSSLVELDAVVFANDVYKEIAIYIHSSLRNSPEMFLVCVAHRKINSDLG